LLHKSVTVREHRLSEERLLCWDEGILTHLEYSLPEARREYTARVSKAHRQFPDPTRIFSAFPSCHDIMSTSIHNPVFAVSTRRREAGDFVTLTGMKKTCPPTAREDLCVCVCVCVCVVYLHGSRSIAAALYRGTSCTWGVIK